VQYRRYCVGSHDWSRIQEPWIYFDSETPLGAMAPISDEQYKAMVDLGLLDFLQQIANHNALPALLAPLLPGTTSSVAHCAAYTWLAPTTSSELVCK
jgi:hypothetical protein